MLVDIATIPEVTKSWLHTVEMGETVAFVKNGQVIATLQPTRENNVMPTIQPKKRQAGLLAHLNLKINNEELLAPMSKEDLALWNGDFNDEFGITLCKENGNV